MQTSKTDLVSVATGVFVIVIQLIVWSGFMQITAMELVPQPEILLVVLFTLMVAFSVLSYSFVDTFAHKQLTPDEPSRTISKQLNN